MDGGPMVPERTGVKATGTVQYEDLEGGIYVLETTEGETYMLDGGDENLLKAGIKVEVIGEVAEGVGLGMTGHPVLRVDSYKML